MKFSAFVVGLAFLAPVLTLTACGGGADLVYVDGDAAISVSARVNNDWINGRVFAGQTQTLVVSLGEAFELTTSGPVEWVVLVSGQTIAGPGSTILYGGAAVQEVFRSDSRWAARSSASSPLPTPIDLTVLARSIYDPLQSVTIYVRITN